MPRGQRRIELVKRGRQTVEDRGGSTSSVVAVTGCPVLDPIQCQCPKEEVDPTEGVKMTCTWESCPYSSQPLHAVCYQLLEDNLVKRLATLGSARGWTVPQRRNNLWERKGQSLVGKYCRCRCNRGQMTRDKQALYEKEKAVEKEKKKKAKKAKQLPMLQFNSKPSAVMEDKKRGDIGVNSPSAASSHHHFTFSNATRSRLHTDRSTSTMLTYTVGRTWSESSFNGETNGQYDNNDFHPSDCDCVFHYDYDADDDNEHDHDHMDDFASDIVEVENQPPSEVIVPAPLPPPQSRSYAATIKNQDDKLIKNKKQSDSPDSGLGKHNSRLSFSSSSNDEELDSRRGDYQHMKKHEPVEDFGLAVLSAEESLNPLGLSILSPLEVSSSESNQPEESTRFLQLTATPHLPKKRESVRHAAKSSSVSKLPLATPSQVNLEEQRCGFSFNAPVREMMDIWQATASASKSSAEVMEEKQDIDMSWTPFFGRGFNLGERLYYMP